MHRRCGAACAAHTGLLAPQAQQYGRPTERALARACGEFAPAQHGQTRAQARTDAHAPAKRRSEEHTSELQSLMRISYAVFCLKKKQYSHNTHNTSTQPHI